MNSNQTHIKLQDNAIRDILERGNLEVLEIESFQHEQILANASEVLERFDQDPDYSTSTFLIKIKNKFSQKKSAPPVASSHGTENIYLDDGKLNVPFLLENAQLLLKSKDYPLARNIFRAIIQSGEKTAQGLLGLGSCFAAEGKYSQACKAFEESIAYQSNIENYHLLAECYLKQKKDQHAAEVLERALSLKNLQDHQKVELHKAVGNAWMRSNQIQKADAHYQSALKLDPSSDEIRCNLGSLYLFAQNIPEARSHFQDALAANPTNPQALIGIGSCYLSIGEKRLAHDHFARALDLDIHHPNAIFHVVKCAYELKTYATAARLLEEYILCAPVNASLLYSLAGLQFHLGRLADAQATLSNLDQIQPNFGPAKALKERISKAISH